MRLNSKENTPVIWFTGLPCSGKTTLARFTQKRMQETGVRSECLDGDDLRQYLSPDLGFSPEHRFINIKRAAYLANLLSANGIIPLVSLVTPYSTHRSWLRKEIGNFVEVFVDAPLNVCERRDVRGLYRKARSGEIEGFTGIDDKFEAPVSSDLHIRTDLLSIEDSVDIIISYLNKL